MFLTFSMKNNGKFPTLDNSIDLMASKRWDRDQHKINLVGFEMRPNYIYSITKIFFPTFFVCVPKVKNLCLHQVPQMLNLLVPPAQVKLPLPASQGSPGDLIFILRISFFNLWHCQWQLFSPQYCEYVQKIYTQKVWGQYNIFYFVFFPHKGCIKLTKNYSLKIFIF